MDLDFLGGKYHKPEEIVHGPVQSFRAQNAATGRPVYIHRVSTTEEQAQQSALLLLLASAMTRSAAVKRLVLDVGEEKGFWYVVTEFEQQCLALREWLQFEIDNASGNANAGSQTSGRNLQPPPPAARDKQQDAGEFTRMFRRQPMRPNTPPPPPPSAGQPAAPLSTPPVRVVPSPPAAAPSPTNSAPPTPHVQPGEFTRMFQTGGVAEDKPAQQFAQPSQHPVIPAPVPPTPAKPLEPPKKDPGEFTRMFLAQTPGESVTSAPPPPSAPPFPGPSKSQPGEFTRFFTEGLPPAAKKPPNAPPPSPAPPAPPQDLRSDADLNRTQQMFPTNVQRPNTPPPPNPRQPADPGEFTRLFSTSPGSASSPSSPASNPNEFGFGNPRLGDAPDLAKPKEQPPDIFDLKPEAPMPLPTQAQERGEYTRLFGKGDLPPAPKQAAVAPTPSSPLNNDDLAATKALPVFTTPATSPGRPPSEFTLMTQTPHGLNPSAPPAPSSPSQKGGAPLPGSFNFSAPSVPSSLPGIHPPSASGSVGPSGGSFNSSLGSAGVAAPKVPAPSPLNLPKPQIPPVPAMPTPGGSNTKKLYILFGVLLAAVIILIIVVVVVMAKK